MPLTSKQITDAAIQHGEASGDPEYAVGDLEIVLQIAIEILTVSGQADRFESAVRDGIGLESLNEYMNKP